MEVEIKVKIGDREVSMEEARKIYEALKGLFEKRAAKPDNDLWDLIKRNQAQAERFKPLIPMTPSPLPYPHQDLTRPIRFNEPYWPRFEVYCAAKN